MIGERLEAAYQKAVAALLAERTPAGHWVGQLSTSALSTATAVMALHLVDASGHADLSASGLRWLVDHQNEDGGWGDTIRSFSNISTTMLCRAAFHLTGHRDEPALRRAETWLSQRYGPRERWPEEVRQRYGTDRTFATPILTTCALAGLVAWEEVPPLPFELACLPQSWFRLVRLHVVSYALPALIAIGQTIYAHHPPRNPVTRALRSMSRAASLRVLEKIQPSSGGYLEAVPLTSFVTLSLASIGLGQHPVAVKAVEFLRRSVLPDGSWAIDSNLATWVTTLSINALAAAGELQALDRLDAVRDWLLGQQYKERHPYTGAAPGGWAWTDLPGGVPDGDDTPGALLATANLDAALGNEWHETAIPDGVGWLLSLQNRDGGWPTFCRGWGHLPFDRSGSDLTAHVLRALQSWIAHLSEKLKTEHDAAWEVYGVDAFELSPEAVGKVTRPGFAYLARHQRPDGSWLPLWFGNQHAPEDENPAYGTARVLAAYRDLDRMNDASARRGVAWLLANQNADGGWGGGAGTPSSVEETALAVEILVDVGAEAETAVEKGLAWLVAEIEAGGLDRPTPIGFYFAKLWYFEKLYPIIFSVAALGRARLKLRRSSSER